MSDALSSSVASSRVPRSRHASGVADYPGVLFDHQTAPACRGRWGTYFQDRISQGFAGQIVLEVGCFDAGFLADVAAAYPSVGFVGLDWKFKPLIHAAQRLVASGHVNLALIRGRAQDLMQMFAPTEVDQIWVFHPEPCDEPKQRPNRLLSEIFFNHAHRLLPTGGRMIIKTDHAEYAHSTHSLLQKKLTHLWTIDFVSADFWHDPKALQRAATHCFAGRKTFYESRYLKRRQPIGYLEIVAVAAQSKK